MKFLLVLILGLAIALSSNVFAGGKEECKESHKEHKEKAAEGKKADKPEMCEMKVTGKVTKVECGKDKEGKDKPCKCVITTAEGETVTVWCADKDKAEQLSKCEGKDVCITGKGIEKKDKEGKSHKVIKSVDKIEEAPAAPAPEK